MTREAIRFEYGAGVRRIRTPLLAPDANAFAESWIGSFKRECLDHFTCFSLGHLDHIGQEYVSFFNRYRPHQGLGNLTIDDATSAPAKPDCDVRARLGSGDVPLLLGRAAPALHSPSGLINRRLSR